MSDSNEEWRPSFYRPAAATMMSSCRPAFPRAADRGRRLPNTKSKLPNLSNVWDMVSERTVVFDPGSRYSINYMWGTIGIGTIIVAKIKEVLGTDSRQLESSVRSRTDRQKLKGLASTPRSSTDADPVTLAYLGLNPAATSRTLTSRARKRLLRFAPSCASSISSNSSTASPMATSASRSAGRVTCSRRDRAEEADNGVELNYVIPKERRCG